MQQLFYLHFLIQKKRTQEFIAVSKRQKYNVLKNIIPDTEKSNQDIYADGEEQNRSGKTLTITHWAKDGQSNFKWVEILF